MRVRMVQQISGGRPDGTPWPDPGAILEVGDAEGAELCRDDGHGSAIAVPIAVIEKRAETPEAKLPEPETRAEPEAAEDAETSAEDASEDTEAPARRGPGRPRRVS